MPGDSFAFGTTFFQQTFSSHLFTSNLFSDLCPSIQTKKVATPTLHGIPHQEPSQSTLPCPLRYGQTGAGKTFTMYGTKGPPRIGNSQGVVGGGGVEKDQSWESKGPNVAMPPTPPPGNKGQYQRVKTPIIVPQ